MAALAARPSARPTARPTAHPSAEPSPNAFERDLDYQSEITARSDKVRWLVIPARHYLMIEGSGPPGGQEFQDAISTLYPVAYTLHFALKKRSIQAPVGALEGLLWIGTPEPIPASMLTAGPSQDVRWTWRLMLPVPDEAQTDEVQAAIAAVAAKKKRPPLLGELRCQAWDEGPVAQILHIGPYDAEAPTLERLYQAITDAGLTRRGCHHEIYISDPGRTGPDRIKTVLRQPVEAPEA